MNTREFFIYLAIMAISTYLIRAIPFATMKKKVENRFVKSFLHYIPYAVLTAMTLPGALYATESMVSAAVGILCAILVSLKCRNLTVVACTACLGVLVCEFAMKLI